MLCVLLTRRVFDGEDVQLRGCRQHGLWDFGEEAHQSLDVLRSRRKEELLPHELQSPIPKASRSAALGGISGIGILRHANVSTTANYYIKTVPTQVTDAMERLQGALPESLTALEGMQRVKEPMPESLSGNEVAAPECNATASSAVN